MSRRPSSARWLLTPLLLGACGPAHRDPPPTVPPSSSVAVVAPAPASSSAPTDPDPLVAVQERDVRWGSEQAPVTVVLFGALSDETSGRALRHLDALQRDLGPDRVRVVWKPLLTSSSQPFRRTEAEVVAGLSVVGGRDAAQKLLQVIARTEDTSNAVFTLGMSVVVAVVPDRDEAKLRASQVEALADVAGIEGLDPTRQQELKRRVLAGEFRDVVQQDAALASRLAVNDAPTLFVNGRRLTGLAPRAVLTSVVNEELRLAQELRAQGRTVAQAYALRTQQNAGQRQDFPLRRPPLKDGERRRVVLGQSPALGSPAALVTMVVFGGYGQEGERVVHRAALDLQQRHARDVRLVTKSGPWSAPGAFDSLVVDGPLMLDALQVRADRGDQAFWRVHRRLAGEPLWKEAEAKAEAKHPNFLWNDSLVLEVVRARLEMKPVEYSVTVQQALAADLAQSRELAITDCAVFLNGRVLNVPSSSDLVDDSEQKKLVLSLRTALDEELALARRRVAEGTKPAQLYETMMSSLPAPIDD